MSQVTQSLPNDPAELARMVLALRAENEAKDQLIIDAEKERDAARAEAKAAKAGLILKVLEIEKLKIELARLKRQRFGQSSERFAHQIEQLELHLEDIEADLAEELAPHPDLAEQLERERNKQKIKPVRKPLPDFLPRKTITIPAPDETSCGQCGGAMKVLGVDVTEVLDYVPASLNVIRYERQKCACSSCDAISEAPAPNLPIPRGKAGPGLLAHVIVSKYCDHIPLYRQEGIRAREGVDIKRSTMSGWVGHCAWLLRPLVDLIAEQVFAASKIHTDDTPVKTLAPGNGRTKTGRLWIYVRDDRNWQPDGGAGGSDPPAALYYYSPDRKGERPKSHLARYTGYMQADGYPGYDQIYRDGSRAGPITEVACWAHARRKIHDVWIARKSPTAKEGLEIIARIYALDDALRCKPPEVRFAGRQVVRNEVNAFFAWGEAALRRLSNKDSLAQAIRYAMARREALSAFLDDGRLEIDNNRAENSLRAVALGRKNWLFAGSDKGGERTAIFYSLMETAKLNNVEPFAWLRDVLESIGNGHPINRLDELLPWNWKPLEDAAPSD